jgi:hypothetical protein
MRRTKHSQPWRTRDAWREKVKNGMENGEGERSSDT